MLSLPSEIAPPPPRSNPGPPGQGLGFAFVIALFLAMAAGGLIAIQRGLAQRSLGTGPSTQGTLSHAAPSRKSKGATFVEYHYVGRDGVARVGNDTIPSSVDRADLVPGRSVTVWEAPALWRGPVSASEPGLGRKRSEGTGVIIAGVWIAGWGLLFAVFQTRSRIRRQFLLVHGMGTLATVTRFNASGMAWRYQRVGYEFDAPTGKTSALGWVTNLQVRKLGKPKVGETVAVLYDPAQPERSILYSWGAGLERSTSR